MVNARSIMGDGEALDYLRRRGYLILKERYPENSSLIDLIARKNDTLILCDVRIRIGEGSFSGIDGDTYRNMVRAGSQYLISISRQYKIRIDLINIRLDRRGVPTSIEHIEDFSVGKVSSET